jgi:hypothetical protein
MQFVINFTNDISLIYDLIDEEIAQQWADLISKRNITECCKINHYNGYASSEMIQVRIKRLYELADYINEFSTERVIKQEINKDTWKLALHKMHVHFPKMKNDEKIQRSLAKFNGI